MKKYSAYFLVFALGVTVGILLSWSCYYEPQLVALKEIQTRQYNNYMKTQIQRDRTEMKVDSTLKLLKTQTPKLP